MTKQTPQIMKEGTQTSRTNAIAFRESLISGPTTKLKTKAKARKEPVKMENNLSLPWKQKAPGNKYEIPYNFSKLVSQLEMAAVKFRCVKTLVGIQSSRTPNRNHVTSKSFSWTNK